MTWLTVLGDGRRGHKRCRCVCGVEKEVNTALMESGRIVSCGCYRRMLHTKHGLAGSKVYQAWWSMIDRCHNPDSSSFGNYGERGISVCERWRQLDRFVEDMGHPPSPEHSLDRINNDGNYEPDNCRWTTGKTQARNRRTSVWITAFGETKSAPEWSDIHGVAAPTIIYRVKAGWNTELAVTKTSNRKH